MPSHCNPPRRRAVVEHGLALLGCLAVGLLALAPLARRAGTHMLADDQFGAPGVSDAYNFLWGYWWVQHAVCQGTHPFRCTWVCPPGGVNLFYHTMVVLPSLLTLPLAWLCGTLVGYNGMIWLMLSFAAFSFRTFLRTTFGLRRGVAFVVGLLFGFSPYFIFKAHNGLNCMGACFWASALAALVSAYVRGRFTLRRGVVFGVFVWATFWTSFQELFMLGVACALAVAAMEARRGAHHWRSKAVFLVPLLLGGVSLLAFRLAPGAGPLARPRVDGFGLLDLLSPSVFTMPGRLWHSANMDYWGIGLPWGVMALALVGYAQSAGRGAGAARRPAWLVGAVVVGELLTTPRSIAAPGGGVALADAVHMAQVVLAGGLLAAALLLLGRWRGRSGLAAAPGVEGLREIALLAAVLLVCTLDVLHAPSAAIRAIPFGHAFRVFSRFFPFALFFVLILAAHGLEWLWANWRDARAKRVLIGLVILTAVECVPCGLRPSPVPRLELPPKVAERLDPTRRVWYAPVERWRTVVDTYQITLGLPAVHAPALSRGGIYDRAAAMKRYPVLYGAQSEFTRKEFMAEARQLRVGYILFENAGVREQFPMHTRVLAKWGDRVLAALAL